MTKRLSFAFDRSFKQQSRSVESHAKQRAGKQNEEAAWEHPAWWSTWREDLRSLQCTLCFQNGPQRLFYSDAERTVVYGRGLHCSCVEAVQCQDFAYRAIYRINRELFSTWSVIYFFLNNVFSILITFYSKIHTEMTFFLWDFSIGREKPPLKKWYKCWYKIVGTVFLWSGV